MVTGAAHTPSVHVESRAQARITTTVLVVFGAVLSAVAVHSGWGRDFASFYAAAATLADGSDPYRTAATGGAININLPHVTALLIPLAALPFDGAFAAWQGLQLVAWGALLYGMLRDRPVRGPEFVAAAVLFPGTLAQIAQGQWGFALAWVVGMAWNAHRRERELEAGLWIGVAAAAKPFVALLIVAYVVQRRFQGAAAAACVVVASFAGGILLLGSDPYVRWSATVADIQWAGYPSNASLLGLAERTFPEDVAGLVWALACLIVTAATLLAARRRTAAAASWAVVLAGALLVSPLGWLYYGWILAPPLLSLPRWSLMLKAGLVLLWVPPGWLSQFSTATIGLFVFWLALVTDGRWSGQAGREPCAT